MTLSLAFESILNDLRDALNTDGKAAARSHDRHRQHLPFVPNMEPLEDRKLPATAVGMNLEPSPITWGGGCSPTPSWSPGPGSGRITIP